MILNLTHHTLSVVGAAGVPHARTVLRHHLVQAQFSPVFVGQAVVAFSSLAELLLGVDTQHAIALQLEWDAHRSHGMTISSQVPGAAYHIHELTQRGDTLRRVVDQLDIRAEDGYVKVVVTLYEQEGKPA